jgi:hypothetical protein
VAHDAAVRRDLGRAKALAQRPAAMNASIAASGSIVILRPGM